MQAFAWNCMNQALDAKGEAVAVETVRREYRCQGTGADRSVRAKKARNGAGATGSGQTVGSTKQLATG
jgi:hypothetical protein